MLMSWAPNQEAIIIPEQSMAVYEQFYILYSLAVSILVTNTEATFVSLFVDNKTFRNAIIDCLKVMGISKPELLTPRTMQELIISRLGPDGKHKPGYLFELHQEVPPNPKKWEKKTISHQKRSIRSILHGWWQLTLLKTLPFLNAGLSVAF